MDAGDWSVEEHAISTHRNLGIVSTQINGIKVHGNEWEPLNGE